MNDEKYQLIVSLLQEILEELRQQNRQVSITLTGDGIKIPIYQEPYGIPISGDQLPPPSYIVSG